ncbi:MAG TPA: serine hydrolase [Sphingomicrobium sp.]|nr:serine hydrolase [Sphingomicrobium sp.]
MKIGFASLGLLASFWAAALSAQPAAVPLTPEQAASFQKQAAQVLFWSQQQRDENFRKMDSLFPALRVAAGEGVALARADSLVPALGGEAGADALMDSLNMAGLLVLQDGKIRLERYRRGFAPDQRWTSFSVAKSLTSSLVGAALKDGHIQSLDDQVTAYIPELVGSAYEGVTVRQLLTMTSGVRWNEDYTDPDSEVARMLVTPAPPGKHPLVAFMATLPREVPSGSQWVYKTGETGLVGVLVEKATGKSLADYLSEKIWRPYGMEKDAFWQVDVSGGNIGGCCLSATLRDYGRFGQFILEGGRAGGVQILPESWVEEATASQADIGVPGRGYGYQWWTGADGSFAALGIFGQMIHVDPANRLVIVTLSAWPKATAEELSAARSAAIAKITAAALAD